MAKEKLFQVGVKALITNSKNEILILDSGDWHLKHQTRHWDIPGGRIQEGQSHLEALKREVEEETGIKKITDVQFLTAAFSNFKDIPIGEHMVGLLLVIYRVKIPANSTIILSEEHADFEWVDPKEAATRLTYKYPPEFTDQIKDLSVLS